MFVKDIKRDFYDKIKFRVLMLVGYNVDALAATRILQYLFESDNIQYTIIPVASIDELFKAYKENSLLIKYVLLVNIGAWENIGELLGPDEDVTIFIADSHRSIQVHNVYRDDILLLMDSDDIDEDYPIPEKEKLFKDEGEEASDEWKIERQAIIFEYMQHAYWGKPVALLFFNLAWKLSKDNLDLVWLAIIGLCDQLVYDKIEDQRFNILSQYLFDHARRLRNIHDDSGLMLNGDTSTNSNVANSIAKNIASITFEKDLTVLLYRHWTIFESFRHTVEIASSFQIWSISGHKKLLEFFAKLGLPLTQCKQKFAAMDVELRKHIVQWMEEEVNKDLEGDKKFKLTNLIKPTFIIQRGFKHRYSACDIVLASSALLESTSKEKRRNEKFFDGLDCLSWNNLNLLNEGLDLAQIQLIAILRQVQNMLEMKQVVHKGNCLYAIITENTPDLNLFCHPYCLSHLGRFLINAYSVKTKRSKHKPLILMSPDINMAGFIIAVGIPPVSDVSKKNLFRKAFKEASIHGGCQILPDLAHSAVVRLLDSNKMKFLEDVITILKED